MIAFATPPDPDHQAAAEAPSKAEASSTAGEPDEPRVRSATAGDAAGPPATGLSVLPGATDSRILPSDTELGILPGDNDFGIPPGDTDSGTLPHDTEALGDEIARLAAHLHAATYQLLVLIRAFDEREGWGNGFRSCAEWLSWRTGIAPGAAREKVRVARALGSLPRISGSMARGEMSYSKVRALSRVATPENEGELLETARHTTAAQLERLVGAWRRVDRLEEVEREREGHQRRYLRLYPDEDGSYVLRGRLDPEVGALLQQALAWAGEALYRREAGEARERAGASVEGGEAREPVELASTATQRRADALGLLAERAMVAANFEADGEAGEAGAEPESPRAPGSADRFQVVVHVDAEALREGSEEGEAVLADSGLGVSAETSRRWACDSGVVEMRHDPEGGVLDVGRKRRTVPPAIRRALDHRDGGCRFPGCGCRYTDAHHIRHWADGGETRLDNLVLLCRRHHRAVHEEGFRVERVEGDAVRFYRPDGRLLPEVPASPGVPEEPVRELVRVHRERGFEPDAWTAPPLWWGEALDLSLALDMLRHPLARERQAREEKRGEKAKWVEGAM
jgi:5-methylcytosine-specific restriction endonuclease McrA